MNLRIILFSFILLFAIFFSCKTVPQKDSASESITWKKGYLDIHHIHAGRGNAAFMIFPDGTTLLYDAGDAKQREKYPYYPIYPNDSKTPAEWIANYIKQLAPNKKIDYAVISHFDPDHFGHIDTNDAYAKNGQYQLSGITEVGDLISIGTLIDRGFPDYDYPVDLKNYFARKDSTFCNYLKFLEWQQKNNGLKVEQLQAGVNNQITLRYDQNQYPEFNILNIKSNQKIWTGEEDITYDYQFAPPLLEHAPDKFSENALSIVLKINYGNFDYYIGGDLPGFFGKHDFDIETPIAKLVGEVDALTLNHHGYKDATNGTFLHLLRPQAVVHQAIHDPHFQEGIMSRMNERNLAAYSVWMSEAIEEKHADLVNSVYKSKRGHVLIRVYPDGAFFKIIILENEVEKLVVKKIFPKQKTRD